MLSGATSQDERTETLLKSQLLTGCSPEVWARVMPLWHHRQAAAGETLFTAAQPGTAIYLILSGTIKIHVEQHDGSDVFIDIASAGDVLGEMSIVEDANRTATALAMEDTSMLIMDRTAFENLLDTTPCITQNIARILSKRLRRANERIQAMSRLDTYGRVAEQLLFLVGKYGQETPNGIRIPIRLTQSELAEFVGATRERVNQVMTSFKRNKILSTDSGNHITVHDTAALTLQLKR